jgi:hypothetical protein
MRRVFVLSAVLAASLVHAGLFDVLVTPTWSVQSVDPTIPNGGRINSIAVKPGDPRIVLLGTDSGGIFRSSDQGVSWENRSPDAWVIRGVEWHPTTTNLVFATARADSQSPPSGGLHRSTDGGLNWTKVPLIGSAGSIPSYNQSGYGIDFSPTGGGGLVGSDEGVIVTTDRGATWTSVPFGPGSPVGTVLALTDQNFIACSDSGAFHSSDGGRSWRRAVGFPGITSVYASAGAVIPPPPGQAAVSALIYGSDHWVYRTTDQGRTYSRYKQAPGGWELAGGNAYVRVTPSKTSPTTQIDIYLGNLLATYRIKNASRQLTTIPPGSFSLVEGAHSDPRDLVFNAAGDPWLLGGDGGLEVYNSATDTFQYPATGRRGFNALQVMDVFTHWVGNSSYVSFGTQDNDIWTSGSPTAGPWIEGPGSEGHSFSGPRFVPFSVPGPKNTAWSFDTSWTFRQLFQSAEVWPQPAGVASIPHLIQGSTWIMGAVNTGGFQRGHIITTDNGATWTQLTRISGRLTGQPRPCPSNPLIVYQAYEAPFDARLGLTPIKLARILINLSVSPPTASIDFPPMTGMDGLGLMDTMWDYAPVFGIDSRDPQKLIAPGYFNILPWRRPENRVFTSSDGGNTWTFHTSLSTQLDTQAMGLALGAFPNLSHVSFRPDDARFVIAATRTRGLLYSMDRGVSFQEIPGTRQIPYVPKVSWLTGNEAYVATYGRGIWRLRLRLRYENELLNRIKSLVRIVRFDGKLDPPPLALLVLGGDLKGASLRPDGKLSEIALSPGATWAEVGSAPNPWEGEPSFLMDMGSFQGFPTTPTLTGGDNLFIGLAFDETGKCIGYITGGQVLDPHPDSDPFDFGSGNPVDPVTAARKAEITSPQPLSGYLTKGSPVNLNLRGLPQGSVQISSWTPKALTATIDSKGEGAITIPAPQATGRYAITIYARGRIVERLFVNVAPVDNPFVPGPRRKEGKKAEGGRIGEGPRP